MHVVDIACLNVDELHPRDEDIDKTINQEHGNSLLTKDLVLYVYVLCLITQSGKNTLNR